MSPDHETGAPGGPEISVIVPFLNAEETLERSLRSVLRSEGVVLELIAVDDGSTDKSAKIATALGARVLSNPRPRGPAVARNQGAVVARAPVLLFLDADVTVGPNTVARAASWFGPDSPYDAVMGSYGPTTPAPGFWSRFKNLQHHFTHQNAREEAKTFWSGCGAVRADRFRSLGGFSEAFDRPCVEDMDFGYRLTGAGGRIRLDKVLQVTHWKTYNGWSLLRSDLFDRAIPWTRLILRYRAFNADLNTSGGGATSVALAAAVALALLAAPWRPWILGAIPLALAALAYVNRSFLKLCRDERGLWFAGAALFALLLHYFVGGCGLVLGVVGYPLSK